MDVSVIVVNYNTLQLTDMAIESLFEKTKKIDFEIILVDNASSDNSVDYFEKKYGLSIVLIKNDKNVGFGNANNIGLTKAKGKYIFLLNSDTIILNNVVKIFFDFMEQNEKVAICGGNLYCDNMSPNLSFSMELPNLKTELLSSLGFYNKKLTFNYSEYPKEVGYISGADMFIRKSVIEKLGYFFDKDFFMYCEEVEFTSRVKKEGYKVYSVPNAHIIHLESKSIKLKENKIRMISESRCKYFFKVFGIKNLILANVIVIFGFILRFFKSCDLNYIKFSYITGQEMYKYLKIIARGEK